MIDDRDKERLHDWIDGRLDDREAEAFARRVMADPELTREHAELTRLVSQLATLRDERAPSGFARSVERATTSSGPRGPGRPIAWLGVIASLAAALAFAALYMQPFGARRFSAEAPSVEKALGPNDRGPSRFGSDGRSDESDDPRQETSAETAAVPESPATRPDPDSKKTRDSVEFDKAGWSGADDPVESKPAAAPGASAEAVERKREEAKSDDVRDTARIEPGTESAEVVTLVWRVKKSPPAGGFAAPAPDRDPTASNESADARDDGKPGAALQERVREAIESIRARAPQRVVEIEMDEASRSEFLAAAAKAGWTVDELAPTEADGIAAAAKPEPAVLKSKAVDQADDLLAAANRLSTIGAWNRIAPDTESRTDRRGSTPLGGAAGAKPAEGQRGGPPTAGPGAAQPEASDGNKSKDAAPGRSAPAKLTSPSGNATKFRVVVVYEFDPPK